MTVNWDALAAVAEVPAAIGVFASLLYLGRQIHQNTVWLRQQAFQIGTNEVRRWAARIRQGWFEGWFKHNSHMFSVNFKVFVEELLARNAGGH
jgi:hypothetical protein